MLRDQVAPVVTPAVAQTNPVFHGIFADPFVFRHEGVYYAVGTGPGSADGRMELPMLRSENFVDWRPLGHALIRPDVPGRNYWAPEIASVGGRFYLYYSVGDERHILRVATSDRPEGPYRDVGTPLLDPETAPFAIDPHPFRDVDGTWYLYYARDFPDAEGGARPGTALAVARMHGMTRISAEFKVVTRAHHDWQRYERNRPMYGRLLDWHTLEGPCVARRGGQYYCLYSGGNWQNESYGVDYVVADSPMGPFIDTNPGDHPRLLRTTGKLIGPGHNSIVPGPDGETDYIAYHAWEADMTARRMCLSALVWTPSGPKMRDA